MSDDFEKVELTEEETKEAILEGKKKKYFRLKHADDWKHDPDLKGAGDDYPVIEVKPTTPNQHAKFDVRELAYERIKNQRV